jgi:hypothetical protein
VLWIRIGFNADLDPAFYLNADPDPRSGSMEPMRIHADPDPNPGQTLNFSYMKIIPKIGNRSRNIHTNKGTKAFLIVRKPGLFVSFGQFLCSWITISIPNTDPDSGQPNQ